MSTVYFIRLVKKFEEAVREHEMLGSKHPDEHHDIEIEYNQSKERLIDYYHKKTQL